MFFQTDPRYFDPKKLLKQNPPPTELSAGDAAATDQPIGANSQSEGVTDMPAKASKPSELKMESTKAASGNGSNADLKTTSKTGTDPPKLLDAGKTDVADGQTAAAADGQMAASADGQMAGPDGTITDDPDDTTIPPTEQGVHVLFEIQVFVFEIQIECVSTGGENTTSTCNARQLPCISHSTDKPPYLILFYSYD